MIYHFKCDYLFLTVYMPHFPHPKAMHSLAGLHILHVLSDFVYFNYYHSRHWSGIIIINIVVKIAIGGIGSMMVIITNVQTTATRNNINKKCLV